MVVEDPPPQLPTLEGPTLVNNAKPKNNDYHSFMFKNLDHIM